MLEISRKWGMLALALATAGAIAAAPVALRPMRAYATDGIEAAEEGDPGQVYRGRGAFDFEPTVHYVAPDGTRGTETCTMLDAEGGCAQPDVMTVKGGWWLLDYSNVMRDTTIEVTGDAHFVVSGPVDLGSGHIHVTNGAHLSLYVEQGREGTTSLTSSRMAIELDHGGTISDIPFQTSFAFAPEIKYRDENGKDQYRDKADFECDLGTFENEYATLNSAWYYVSQSNTIEERIEVAGDAKIVLCPGATLNCAKGIHVPSGKALAVYSNDGHRPSELVADASGIKDCAGIGGNKNEGGGVITIAGGDVTAKGGEDAAGIGGGCYGVGGKITIAGGQVDAEGKEYGAGIGGGRKGEGGTITIRKGIVHAKAKGSYGWPVSGEGAAIGGGDSAGGGSISILGGYVGCEASSGAGIGGGYSGAGGSITIRNASVSVEQVVAGYKDCAHDQNGAGIGSGYKYDGTDPTEIVIEDSNVSAMAADGAAIGSGYRSPEATITIRNSHVDAQTSGSGAGIGGGGFCAGGKVTIGGSSQVIAVSNSGSGIGGGGGANGGTVDISGDSTVEAQCVKADGGAAIGRGCANAGFNPPEGVGTVRLSDNLKVTDLSDNVGMVATFGEREGYCQYRSHAKVEPGESRK